MESGLRRSGQFMKMARQIFKEEGVPVDITWLGQVESAWKPKAMSWAAASGLWQFIPGTGRQYGLRQTAWVDERNSFEQATRASAKYLKDLANHYNGNWELAMAAYNTGHGNVDRAISRAGHSEFLVNISIHCAGNAQLRSQHPGHDPDCEEPGKVRVQGYSSGTVDGLRPGAGRERDKLAANRRSDGYQR